MTFQGTVINGLIVLDQPSQLPEGARVEVMVKERGQAKQETTPARVSAPKRATTETMAPKRDWFQALQDMRTRREAEGYSFMTEPQTRDHVDWLREEDRIDELLRAADEQRRSSQT